MDEKVVHFDSFACSCPVSTVLLTEGVYFPFVYSCLFCHRLIDHMLLSWLSGKESACQCRRPGFDPWVRNIPWRRAWPSTLVWRIPWTEKPGGLQSRGWQKSWTWDSNSNNKNKIPNATGFFVARLFSACYVDLYFCPELHACWGGPVLQREGDVCPQISSIGLRCAQDLCVYVGSSHV